MSSALWPLVRNHCRPLLTPGFGLLAAAGFTAWLLPAPGTRIGLGWVFFAALAEEIAFRFGLQHVLERLFSRRVPSVGPHLANLGASGVFALSHLVHHPPVWALVTFVPSLAFGWLWTRHRNLLPCWALHSLYNILYFYRP